MTYEDLSGLAHDVICNQPPSRHFFSIVSVKMLTAFKYWLHLQDRIGSVDEDYASDRGEGFVTLERLKEVDQLEKACKDLAPTNMASG